jgi:hypothetical protein
MDPYNMTEENDNEETGKPPCQSRIVVTAHQTHVRSILFG